jgi:CHAT domain-containing protein
MDGHKYIEVWTEKILKTPRSEWGSLYQSLMVQPEPKSLVNRIKLQAFDRFLHTNLDNAQCIADFFCLSDQPLEEGQQEDGRWINALGMLAQSDMYLHKGEYKEAVKLFEEASKAFKEAGDEVGWARTRIGWVLAATYTGQITEPKLLELEGACQIFQKEGQVYRQVMLKQHLALAWRHSGNFQKAIELFEQASTTLGNVPTPEMMKLQGMVLANIATTLTWSGSFAQAYAYYDQARTIFTTTESTGLIAQVNMHLSVLERLNGHARAALRLIREAIEGLRLTKLFHRAALALTYQADLLLTLNRYEEAVVAVSEAVNLLYDLGDIPDLVNAYCIQARAFYHNGDVDAALACLLQAEQLSAQTETLYVEYPPMLERASLLLACGRAEEAKEVALAFLKRPTLEENFLHRQSAILIAAEAYLHLGKLPLACSMATKIIQQGEELRRPELFYRGHLLLARAAFKSRDLSSALTHFDAGISALYHLQLDLVYDQRSDFLEDKDYIYEEAMLAAIEAGKPLKALIYLEQRRGRVHWKMGGQFGTNNELEVLLARHQALSMSLLTLERNTLAQLEVKSELKRLEWCIRDLQEAEAQKETGVTALDEKELLAAIPENSPVFSYALVQDDLLIFVMFGKQVFFERKVGGAIMLRKLERSLTLLIEMAYILLHPEEIWQKVLRQLWMLLIDPVKDYLPPNGEALTLIPSNSLYWLPLAALYDGQCYLAERWKLHCIHSCLALSQPAKGNHEMPVLALGYSGDGKLPGAPKEAREIAHLLGGEAWVEQEATGERLRQQKAYPAYLHIASHANFRQDIPQASFFQLADGLFHPSDVLTLDLRGCHLVTLSACRSGLGRAVGGDEQVGLVRAFHFAGVEAVLATLWQIDDTSTLNFMRHFYHQIAQGSPPACALQHAQYASIQQVDATLRSHPYFWAGFQLVNYTRH